MAAVGTALEIDNVGDTTEDDVEVIVLVFIEILGKRDVDSSKGRGVMNPVAAAGSGRADSSKGNGVIGSVAVLVADSSTEVINKGDSNIADLSIFSTITPSWQN